MAAPRKKGPYDTGECHEECGHAGFTHAVDVRFNPRNEHQHQAPELRQKHQSSGRLPSVEEMKMEQVDCARAKDDAYQKFTQNGGNTETTKQRSREFACRKENGQQQRKLKSWLHDLADIQRYGRLSPVTGP